MLESLPSTIIDAFQSPSSPRIVLELRPQYCRTTVAVRQECDGYY